MKYLVLSPISNYVLLLLYTGVIIPFFDVWPDSAIAFAGPWLIDLSKAMHLHEKLRELETRLPAVCWLAARCTAQVLMKHLSPFLNVALPDGSAGLLRLWDPRVAERLPQLMEYRQWWQLISGVEDWLFIFNGSVQSLKGREAE
jgi:hypothetical protein